MRVAFGINSIATAKQEEARNKALAGVNHAKKLKTDIKPNRHSSGNNAIK
jgi:hypothetical protein